MPCLYNDNDPKAAAWLRELIRCRHLPNGEVDERPIEELEPADCPETFHAFAGIGGWPLALEMAGWTGPVWTGSCPCQPFSAAGKRRGTDDERHVWPSWFRLIREARPPIIFGEQVASAEVVGTQLEAAFVVAVQGGDYAKANRIANRLVKSRSLHYHERWVTGVRADLEREGYAVRWNVLGAHSVNAPHIRQRLFWVAHRTSKRRTPERDEPTENRSAREGSEPTGELPSRTTGRCQDGGLAVAQGQQVGRAGQPRERAADGVAVAARELDNGGGDAGARGRDESADGGGVERLATAKGSGQSGEQLRADGESPQRVAEDGAYGGLDDPAAPRLEPERTGAEDAPRHEARLCGPECRCSANPWSHSDLLPCRDGKARRVEPGSFPLAHGVPASLGRLRGYGNAIVPQVAAVFARCLMEVSSED